MRPVEPPRVAVLLLERLLPENEALIGDLVERFAAKRSRVWFWRETLSAILSRARRPLDEVRPLKLVRDPAWLYAERRQPPAALRSVNLTGSPVPGIGGLGLVVLGLDVALARPGAVLMLLPAVPLGAALGLALTLIRRRGLTAYGNRLFS